MSQLRPRQSPGVCPAHSAERGASEAPRWEGLVVREPPRGGRVCSSARERGRGPEGWRVSVCLAI